MASETSNFDYLALKDEGNALYSAGDFLGAVQKYSKALKLCADNNTDRTTLLKNRAAAYLNLREYQKVIEDTTAALEITPNDIKALYRRCQTYEQLGKYNEAFEDARAVNRLNPQNSAIQPYLRRLQEIKPDIIEESTKTVLSETSNLDYLALKDEGNALYLAGDFSAALQKYSTCLKLCTDKNTDRSTLLKNRAAAYLNLEEYHKVVEDTTAALEITPRDIKALYRRCQAYEQLGKYNEAFEDARAVNRLNPQNSAIQPYLRRLQKIQPVIVEESSETVLSETSDLDYLAIKDEGNALYSARNFRAAVQKYSKCLKLCIDNNNDRSTLLKNRAAAFLDLCEYLKVVEDTTEALQITPSDIKALCYRCQAYERLGKFNEAFQDARIVNHLNPENSAIQPYLRRLQKIVNESNYDVLDINSLRDEIILKIFGYLKQNQLGQIARVYRRWNELTKSPVLWKDVDVNFHDSHESQNTVAMCFIKMLPPCVTGIRMDFRVGFQEWYEQLNFEVFCVRLQRRCPCLKSLILEGAILSHSLLPVIDLCTQCLQDVKNLTFRYSRFLSYVGKYEYFDKSKIEILKLLDCYFEHFTKHPFCKMPNLKQLHLLGTNVDDSWFEEDIFFLHQLHVLNLGRTHITFKTFPAIQIYGLNLKELYFCCVKFDVQHINVSNSIFPHLKIICFFETYVGCNFVVSLVWSCPSLQTVYVDKGFAESFALYPPVVANICKSGIVKVVHPGHEHNVNYSHT